MRLAAGLDHLHAKLVTEDARVGEKRLPPGEGMKVGAAHANAMHAHERLARRLNGGAQSVAMKRPGASRAIWIIGTSDGRLSRNPAARDSVNEPASHQRDRQPRDEDTDTEGHDDEHDAHRDPEQPEPNVRICHRKCESTHVPRASPRLM